MDFNTASGFFKQINDLKAEIERLQPTTKQGWETRAKEIRCRASKVQEPLRGFMFVVLNVFPNAHEDDYGEGFYIRAGNLENRPCACEDCSWYETVMSSTQPRIGFGDSAFNAWQDAAKNILAEQEKANVVGLVSPLLLFGLGGLMAFMLAYMHSQ